MPQRTLPPSEDVLLIDARGHRCPVPTLKLQKVLTRLPTGVVVQLWSDDPMAQIDVPHFCNKNNYLLAYSEVRGEGWVFAVSNPGEPSVTTIFTVAT